MGDLGEPVHDAGDLAAELGLDVGGAGVGVLHHVVEQCRGYRCRVEQLVGQNAGHRDAVGDEVVARHPLLAPVCRGAEAKGSVNQRKVEPVGVAQEGRAKLLGAVLEQGRRRGCGSGSVRMRHARRMRGIGRRGKGVESRE